MEVVHDTSRRVLHLLETVEVPLHSAVEEAVAIIDSGTDNGYWTTGAVSRAKFHSYHHHQQTNIQLFYRPDALPVAQPTVSKH